MVVEGAPHWRYEEDDDDAGDDGGEDEDKEEVEGTMASDDAMMGQVEDEDDEADGHANWSNACNRSTGLDMSGETIPYEGGKYNPQVNWWDGV